MQLGYVSHQLGHADVSVTARHYARWIEGDHYREPMVLRSGEVPADLLARLGDPTSDPSTQLSVIQEASEAPQPSVMSTESMARREGLEPPALRFEA